jgi:hypothetical protein
MSLPPDDTPLTLSEMADHVINAIREVRPGASAYELALRTNLAIGVLMKEGYIREHGFDEQGHVLYEPGHRFPVEQWASPRVVTFWTAYFKED